MNSIEDVCTQFAKMRNAHEQSQYIFAQPRQDVAYLGLGLHQKIIYRRSGFELIRGDGVTLAPCEGNPFDSIRRWLAPERSSFWLVSPDLGRATHDRDLPLILCLQPQTEHAVRLAEQGQAAHQALLLPPAEGWTTETDGRFIERLQKGIAKLKAHPDGKMILTRPYQRPAVRLDPLRLFSLFAGSEPTAAASHYLQIDGDSVSLGCSPENVFEIKDQRLYFDVVAGTRGISSDPDKDALWLKALQNDPKERREHMMAFERYKRRIETLCAPGTVTQEHLLQVLQLGNVRHLYSRLSGQPGNDLDWLGLLAQSMPALTSYPEELQDLADDQSAPLRYYGGIVGHVSANGEDARFYLNLRAALIKKDTLYTQGGVGVIAQSEPNKELLEVKNKLSGLFKAVSEWEISSTGA